ncbi:MAG: hypothetical protein Q8N26_08160 [Myxococcales bacterium]|nr:hypothetical protein [Myxococcales bacterium]
MTLDDEGRCALTLDGVVQWQADTGVSRAAGNPFREAIAWAEAGVVVVGGGTTMLALNGERGAVLARHDIPDGFGRFAVVTSRTLGPLLLVLGWCHVVALDTKLEARWTAHDVAVDGLLLRACDGDVVLLSAELDPPGGWVDVALDVSSGARR